MCVSWMPYRACGGDVPSPHPSLMETPISRGADLYSYNLVERGVGARSASTMISSLSVHKDKIMLIKYIQKVYVVETQASPHPSLMKRGIGY